MPVTRGFRGRRVDDATRKRLPPGQYLERGFPVLSAGPTPHTPLQEWTFTVSGSLGNNWIDRHEAALKRPGKNVWTWEEFRALPTETVPCDIHCVTKWSKLDTTWEGVSLDVLLPVGLLVREPGTGHVIAFSDGGYTTNLPLDDVTGGKAWVVHTYEGRPLEAEHGGPARLLVPHLYFWKSAKWVRGLRLVDDDEPRFWEALGYHNRGDPWLEQRYRGD